MRECRGDDRPETRLIDGFMNVCVNEPVSGMSIPVPAGPGNRDVLEGVLFNASRVSGKNPIA